MKILWAGPYFSEYAFTVKRTPNIASTVWSHGFVKGLLANGADVEVLTTCPEQAWPKGRVVWQDADPRLFDHDVSATAIPYLNVAYARELWQCRAYAMATRRILSSGRFDVFSCYNVLHPYHVAAMREARKMGVKVCPVVLDGGYDPTTDDFAKMSHDARFADGVVFLSQFAADRFPANGRRIMQMEGGVDSWLGLEPKPKAKGEKFVVTYAGALMPHRGQGLVEMMRRCGRTDFRLVVCGKWNVAAVRQAFREDPRVELRGMVGSEKLAQIYAETDVFVNSRQANNGHNLVNFPSKISAYLGYGRPIVSNWVESYPSEYRNILCVSDDDSGAAMARKLEEVLSWPHKRRVACFHTLHKAYDESKSWKMQARKFLQFVSGLK